MDVLYSIFLRITAWFLTKYLSKFLRSVQVCRGQMMMVKEASKVRAVNVILSQVFQVLILIPQLRFLVKTLETFL